MRFTLDIGHSTFPRALRKNTDMLQKDRRANKRTAWDLFILCAALATLLSACSENKTPLLHSTGSDSLSYGLLIPKTALITRSGEFPHDPTRAELAGDSSSTQRILHGFAIFINTPLNAPTISGNVLSCNNCHPNGGQRERAMPLVGVARVFPEYNKRSGRSFCLEDRIIGCLLRSINATGNRQKSFGARHENELEGAKLNAGTQEVKDLAAYITWLSSFQEIGKYIPWRGRNTLASSDLIPIEKLDPKLGKELFTTACSSCHGKDGQGVNLAGGKRPAPLWGPKSWNDGAGAARTYTLAGMIRHWMPYLNPSQLTDEQAQHIAAYITSQPRPDFPFKEKDYLKEKIPVDAVYYKQLYSQNPLAQK
jgi:thiosulfate dehydrogenase